MIEGGSWPDGAQAWWDGGEGTLGGEGIGEALPNPVAPPAAAGGGQGDLLALSIARSSAKAADAAAPVIGREFSSRLSMVWM
jgi:hypothetical protein